MSYTGEVRLPTVTALAIQCGNLCFALSARPATRSGRKVNNKLDFEILINLQRGTKEKKKKKNEKSPRELSVYTEKLIYTKLIYVNLFTRGTWSSVERKEKKWRNGERSCKKKKKKKTFRLPVIRPRFLFKFLFFFPFFLIKNAAHIY